MLYGKGLVLDRAGASRCGA